MKLKRWNENYLEEWQYPRRGQMELWRRFKPVPDIPVFVFLFPTIPLAKAINKIFPAYPRKCKTSVWKTGNCMD